jgi:lycopene beta-cyclase
MALSGRFRDQRILLLDRSEKSTNDRTWCFWEEGEGFFENIVHRSWSSAWFHDHGFSKLLDLSPYRYKMIRGIDFYSHALSVLRDHPYIDFEHRDIRSIETGPLKATVHAGDDTFTAPWVYSSLMPDHIGKKEGFHDLLQHFKGWVIRTKEACFKPHEATLMDFRPAQQHGTTFIYVMPFSETEALVEYTLFSPSLLDPAEYEAGLRAYIAETLAIGSYEIVEQEFGIIPMSDRPFPSVDGRLLHIGTAGGQTKASTGYTFQFIQKQTSAIVRDLLDSGDPSKAFHRSGRRFKWYDSVLLNVLVNGRMEGHDVFRTLFQRNRASDILRFLDNDSSFPQELRLINTLPMLPFLKAGMGEMGKYI